jgi:hypothetical protein
LLEFFVKPRESNQSDGVTYRVFITPNNPVEGPRICGRKYR